jgi:hypothetical protein
MKPEVVYIEKEVEKIEEPVMIVTPKARPYLCQKDFEVDPEDEVVMEAELLKFKPGFEKNFIDRWIQLSTRSLRYYKNHYHSICYLTRPISAVPLHIIESVKPYSIKNQEYKKRDGELYSFMFEVVLM